MRPRPPASGFSLVEVILAVAIFALAVPTMLALLAHLGRLGAASDEALVAQRLTAATRVELVRLARADFDGLAAQVPAMTSTPQAGFALVATRDGVRVQSRDFLRPTEAIAATDQYFLVECWQFASEPLRFDSQKAFLALAVRVSWPYRLPDGSPPAGALHEVNFTVALNR